MKKNIRLCLVILIANISLASAALPPLYQSTNDLEDIAGIIRELGNSGLVVQSVDLRSLSAILGMGGKTCQISFKRKMENHPPGWAGPVAKLEIKSNNCK